MSSYSKISAYIIRRKYNELLDSLNAMTFVVSNSKFIQSHENLRSICDAINLHFSIEQQHCVYYYKMEGKVMYFYMETHFMYRCNYIDYDVITSITKEITVND